MFHQQRSLRTKYSVSSNCAHSSLADAIDGLAHVCLHGGKGLRHQGQHLVHDVPDRPQRMILPHPRFLRKVTDYLTVLLVRRSPAFSKHTSCGWGVVFQQPAR